MVGLLSLLSLLLSNCPPDLSASLATIDMGGLAGTLSSIDIVGESSELLNRPGDTGVLSLDVLLIMLISHLSCMSMNMGALKQLQAVQWKERGPHCH